MAVVPVPGWVPVSALALVEVATGLAMGSAPALVVVTVTVWMGLIVREYGEPAPV